jgi:hypothetical protein
MVSSITDNSLDEVLVSWSLLRNDFLILGDVYFILRSVSLIYTENVVGRDQPTISHQTQQDSRFHSAVPLVLPPCIYFNGHGRPW